MYYKNEYKNRFRILKGGLISLVVASNLYGAPSGGTVVSGTATISQNANTTNINQSSNKAIINWQDFSIKSNETVNFNQPNVNSITLNRVIGNEKSIIDGALNANGQVWLINSNGVLFGKNAKVNTAGIVASTKDISNEDFNNGNYNFKGNSKASIVNEGEIKSLANTHATFIANSVTNKGIIEVHKGTINLVGASDVTLTLNENQNISLKVNKGVLDALVDNQNLLIANGGQIYLTTNAKDELLKGVVNNSGIIEANSIDDLQSEVILFAHGGTTNVDGSIIAKNSFVETSGEKLNVTSNTKVVAKDWLLDPTNILIESTGGDDLAGESVSATAIQNALVNSSVDLQATNNITVNQNITWSTDKHLKLQADNINVNATINNTNQTNGGVYFQAANTTNKVVFGTNGKVVVNNVYQLQWINTALDGKYELGRNIDAGVTKTDTAKWEIEGFNPIGNTANKFNGTFDGLGFTISNLYINRSSQFEVGLFGYTYNATIKNIGLKDLDIRGDAFVGGLVGFNIGTISNSYTSGTVSGTSFVGGLVGYNNREISNSYASGSVTGASYIGGLVGYNYFGTISNSYATGTVTGGDNLGGLVGRNTLGTIGKSFYDKEANSLDFMNDSSYGKTKTEIATELKNASNEWETDLSKGRGYGTDGTTALPFLKNVTKLSNTLFEDGFGTTLNPYKITNWTQLQNINNSNVVGSSYYFSLLNNINSSTTGYMGNSGEGWNPIGNSFNGNFDGLGNTISDLYINRPSQDYIGLFGHTYYATIKNIGIKDLDITGKDYVGALVGYNEYGAISNSYATGNVTGNYVGGLVGLDHGTISNSYATGNVTGNYVGGLVGENHGTISNSYASGTVSGSFGSSYVGGLVGGNYGTIENSYASGSVNGSGNVGGLVGVNYGTISKSFYDKDTNIASMDDIDTYGKTKTEILSLFSNLTGWGTGAGASVEGYEIVLLPYLIGVTKDEDKSKSILFSGGFGTEVSPYTITNWTQLQNINNSNILTQNYYFNLLNNLSSSTSDYANLASNTANSGLGWNPIGNSSNRFNGNFDGLGNTISDLYIKRPTQDYVGLFGYINSGSTIKNIELKNVNITGNYYVGGLVGDNYAGAISNSYATGTVSGDRYVGGLVGSNAGTISNSYSTGTISGNNNVGGLIGNNYGTISNSYASGTVSGTSSYVGGLVGDNYAGAISNSYATGTVSGDRYVGGLVGSNAGTILNSYSTGTISGNNNVGGLSGYNVLTISNSFYDKTKYTGNGVGNNSTHSGVTGKTTQEMSYGETFKNASWDIVADSSVTSLTPVIKWDSINNKYVWAIAPLALTYTLEDKTTTYNGTTQNLSTFYNNSSNIFGTNHSFIDLSKYKFQVAGSDVTGYKDAAIYDNIKLVNNSDSFAILNTSGNTDGKLTINKKDLTISNITANNKTYDGTTTATVDKGAIDYTGKFGSDNIAIDTTNLVATFVDKNVGTHQVNISGITLSGADTNNYNVVAPNSLTASITQKGLTISNITANNKTYDGTTTATLSNIGSLVGLVTGEDLVLNNPTSVIFSSKDVADGITVTASGYTIADKDSFKASNYNLTQTSKTTNANISKADLTATLNDNSKTYDGTSYSGGNGITFNGFVNSETASLLGGNLVYSGTSQGAKDAGNYIISGSGLTSNNYNISFVNGKLTINKKDLTISNITANNKTYDGTTTATLSNIGSLVGLVTGEDLVLNNPTSVIFSSKDVADGITVTASGYTIADKDSFKASNYNLLDTSKTTTANIVASVNPTPNPTPSDNNQKPKVDEQVQRVIASIEPSTNSNSSSNQSVPNSLNSNIRTLSFNGVDETRVINGGVKMPENIANEEDIIK
ncbi:YDG domain-containing protein [Aliarcobacter cryaerophilus]|uniref:GLUG motif-containing protein n=1 Tax=Aliarcobacter cryaerophilus TaxID=28198 RepID=UPI003DA53BB9